jgi:ATP-dependent DNA ligase
MTERAPEVRDLPEGLTLDGELVAWGEDSLPSFPDLCARMLHGTRRWVAITYYAFDLLRVHGESTMGLPFSERRRRLEELDLRSPGLGSQSEAKLPPPGERDSTVARTRNATFDRTESRREVRKDWRRSRET